MKTEPLSNAQSVVKSHIKCISIFLSLLTEMQIVQMSHIPSSKPVPLSKETRESFINVEGLGCAFSLSWVGSVLRTMLASCAALRTFHKLMGARALNWLGPSCQGTIVLILPPVLLYARPLLGIAVILVLSTVSGSAIWIKFGNIRPIIG